MITPFDLQTDYKSYEKSLSDLNLNVQVSMFSEMNPIEQKLLCAILMLQKENKQLHQKINTLIKRVDWLEVEGLE